MKKIMIEDRSYTLEPMTPIDALDFGCRITAILSPLLSCVSSFTKDDIAENKKDEALKVLSLSLRDKENSKILKEAIGHCFTPKNESLSDEYVFNKHFTEYPQDLFVLGTQAVWGLARPFLPQAMLTTNADLLNHFFKKMNVEQ